MNIMTEDFSTNGVSKTKTPVSSKNKLFSYQLHKIYIHFYNNINNNKKSLMKPDTFDFKPTFLSATPIVFSLRPSSASI